MLYSFKDFCDIVNKYEKHFRKCNVTASDLYDLQDRQLITIPHPETKNGVITEHESRDADAYSYACVIAGMSFFHDRIEKHATPLAYIATKFYSKDPYSDTRFIWECAIAKKS